MPRSTRGPKFIQYFDPVIQGLKELGGSARPREVVEAVARIKNVPESQRQEVLKSGALRFDNQIAFARQYLVWGGYLDSSKRGVWTLTEIGRSTSKISDAEALKMFREQHALHANSSDDDSSDNEDEELAEELATKYRDQLLTLIRDLPPSGFERLCQRILRESGFEQVQVTGKAGDGGIDGIGLVRLNTFVTFKVLFQCKRYKETVGPGHVRDFRGAMQGRTDKGIIITTGTFTKEASIEAAREGVPPIDLVDGERLIDLFERLELGLIPRTTYDVDQSFFEEFRRQPSN